MVIDLIQNQNLGTGFLLIKFTEAKADIEISIARVNEIKKAISNNKKIKYLFFNKIDLRK
jgi:hypothetical protein